MSWCQLQTGACPVLRINCKKVTFQHRNKVLQYTPSYFQHFLATIPPTLLKDFAQTVDQEADLQFRRMFYADYLADDFNEKLLGDHCW